MIINLNIVVRVLQATLCEPAIMKWLEEEAKKTETPIDDTILAIIKMALCSK